jgi:hypothetical protein
MSRKRFKSSLPSRVPSEMCSNICSCQEGPATASKRQGRPLPGPSAGPRRCVGSLDEILVEHSSFSRGRLKERLYEAGLKRPTCEMCGQGELWRGRLMGMILDHINGVSDDHRLENLRIVCPNCAATLDTHCGRGRLIYRATQDCARCGAAFCPKYATQRYCSRECGTRHDRKGVVRPGARRVERPPYPQLVREIHALGYCGTARRYGVSDNAIRKWIRAYERELGEPA